jgi:hypothetical protein
VDQEISFCLFTSYLTLDGFESFKQDVLTKNLLAAAERDSDFGHTQKRTRNIKTPKAAGHHDLHRPPLF